MAELAMSRELSISLIGLAGGLLVGNFAAYNGFLTIADPDGDWWVTALLMVSTVLLTFSIIFGGWGIGTPLSEDPGRRYNVQAWLGLFALVAVLAIPLTSLWFREPPDQNMAAQIATIQDALTLASDERTALTEANAGLQSTMRSLQVRIEALEQQLENPLPE